MKILRRLAIVLAAFVLQVAILPEWLYQPSATAAIAWPLSTKGIHPHKVYTHSDGSVTFGECLYSESYTTHTVRSMSHAGSVTSDVQKNSNNRIDGCYGAAAEDGTFYAEEQDIVGDYSEFKVVAFKHSVKLWETGYDVCGMGLESSNPGWLTVGFDGDVYAIMTDYCQGQVKSVLFGLNSQDGLMKFSPIPLTSTQTSFESYFLRLHVYSQGVVVLDGNKLRYFDYNGQSNASDYTFVLSASEQIGQIAASANGRVFASIYDSQTPSCGGTKRVERHDPIGSPGNIDVSAVCINATTMRAMPDDGLLLHEGGTSAKVVRYAQDGSQVYQVPLSSMNGFWDIWHAWPQVDSNSNVVLVRSAVEQTGDHDRHTFVHVINSAGAIGQVFSTQSFDDPATKETFRYTQGELIGIGSDTILLPVCESTCSLSNPVRVYKIDVLGLSFDYPRSTALAAQPQSRKYAALGDSISSGEGVENFIAGTAIDGTNECHRSEHSYAILLDQDPELSLNLTDFAACAGATTENIKEAGQGQWNESPQASRLGHDTELVTITIGGNDLRFGEIATACTDPGEEQQTWAQRCANARQAAWARLANNGLVDEITSAFIEVRVATSNQATILALGYPRIFPRREQLDPTNGCNWGWGVWSRSMTDEELEDLENLTVELNRQIEAATYGLNIHYLDTTVKFADHPICTVDPWFNNVDPSNHEYTYHPNQSGQRALAEVVKEYVS